jgi:flagellar basal-body rod modification protein FlgD
MTTIYPISNAATTPTPTAPAAPDNQMGEDTFLKLLVAQLKYQDPLSPAKGTEFLQQTAQFTELETLQKIQKSLLASQSSSQVLAASSMVGRQVSYALSTSGAAGTPTGTSVISLRGTLPKDAAVGSHTTTTTDAFTRDGTKVTLKLDFARTADGWTVQATNGGHALGAPVAITFDASGDHSSNNLTIPASALDAIAGTTGNWPASGVVLAFGGSDDPTRLQLASGPATVMVAEQNGNDGTNATGVVTGIRITADGPQLQVGGKDIPLTSITAVQA